MYRVFAVHTGIKDSTPMGGTCPNNFSSPVDQDIHIPYALGWKIAVSEWQSVIAVSLNMGSGICLISRTKLFICTQKHYKHTKDRCTAPGVHGHFSVPLNHSGMSLRELDYNNNNIQNSRGSACHSSSYLQLTLVISTSVISNNRLSRRENLIPV